MSKITAFVDMVKTFDDCIEVLRIYEEALNYIASWSEGPIVRPSFDEPASANAARNALLAAKRVLDNQVVSSQGEPGKSSPKPTKSDSLE